MFPIATRRYSPVVDFTEQIEFRSLVNVANVAEIKADWLFTARVGLSPRQFGELIQCDLKHWTTIIDAVGAKVE